MSAEDPTTQAVPAVADAVQASVEQKNPEESVNTDASQKDTPVSTEVVADTETVAAASSDDEEEKEKTSQSEVAKISEKKEKEFPPDFKYNEEHEDLALDYLDHQLDGRFSELHASLGFSFERRYNIHYINYGIMLFASGNTVQLFDIHTNKKEVLFGHGNTSNAGVGGIAVHPSKEFFAVAERGTNPSIYIYKYQLNGPYDVVRVLRRGTEQAYSDVQFNKEGDKLASVGSAPDFLLTIWDWRKEKVILRTKAFSQEITRVVFSPYVNGNLVTSGTSHIKFWKMANTFTGLKLQGSVGKFGNVELSDIVSFVELPDGKVLSGSEPGFLLMWDGNFIKFQMGDEDGNPCHDGVIEVVHLENRLVYTAGRDGFVKVWDYDLIEYAEVSDEEPILLVKPLAEVKISENCRIKAFLRDPERHNHWIVQDEGGNLYKLTETLSKDKKQITFDVQLVLSMHAGGITGLAMSPNSFYAVTCGTDGTVRCWDTHNAANNAVYSGVPGALYSRSFGAPCRSLCWLNANVDAECKTVLVGCDDGVVRCVKRFDKAFALIASFKSHTCPVTSLSLSPDGSLIACGGEDGTIFFLTVLEAGTKYQPLGFLQLEHKSSPVSLHWSSDSETILFAQEDAVYEYKRPVINEYNQGEARDTYLIKLEFRKFVPNIRPPTPEPTPVTEGEEEGAKPEPKSKGRRDSLSGDKALNNNITAVLYSNEQKGKFYVALDGGSSGVGPIPFPGNRYEKLYVCGFNSEVPSDEIHIGANMGTVANVRYSSSGKFLLIGTKNGCSQMRGVGDRAKYFYSFCNHDAELQGTSCLDTSRDDSFFLSCGHDGNFFVHLVDFDAARESKLAEEAQVKKHLDVMMKQANRRREQWEAQLARKQEAEEALRKQQESKKKKRELTEKEKAAEAKRLKEKEMEEAAERAQRLADEQEMLRLEKKKARAGVVRSRAILLPPSPLDEKLDSVENVLEGQDITDSSSYSIEQAKLQQEEDDRVALAEKKKENVRAEIVALREEFKELLAKNALLPKSQQLSRSAFELDPKLRQQIEDDTEEKIAEVKAELAWITEKHDLQLKKLRAAFLDNLIVEHIVLKAFRTNISVSCFRTADLPPFLKTAIEGVHKMIDAEESEKNEAAKGLGETEAQGDGRGRSSHNATSHKTVQLRGGVKKTAVGDSEVRKRAREERRREMEELLENKPNPKEDDPKDLARVAFAERNMGDYKLKSDPAYVVPEHLRVNAERKRRQMFLLQESVHFIKMGLNERFLGLRDLKRRIISNIAKDNVRLRELNAILGIDEDLFEPKIDSAEWPEHRDIVSDADLKAFHKQKRKQAEREEAARRGGNAMFASAFEDDEEDALKPGDAAISAEEVGEAEASMDASADGVQEQSTDAAEAVEAAEAKAKSKHDEVMELWGSNIDLLDDDEDEDKSEMELAEETRQRKLLEYERASLKEKIDHAVNTFDIAVAKLRREKFKLDADLKTTDLKVLTLYHELHELKDFEENENKLFNKLAKCNNQKAKIVAEMTECESQLASKLADIKAWKEKDEAVMTEFSQSVGGEKSEFYPQLLKIFRKRVKRNKRKNKDEDEEEDSDDENQDSDDDLSDEESDSDDEDDDSCPLHCPPEIHEKVLTLRERRLEQEEILNEFKTMVNELNKQYDRLTTREKATDTELKRTEAEIEAFQTQKQKALNAIEVTVPLKISQLKFLKDNCLPQDISDSLIFTSTGIDKLRQRIVDLQEEKVDLKAKFRELKKEHKMLKKDLASKRAEIGAEKKKCEDVQMLKFGQIIDLSILSKVGVDEGAAALRKRLKSLERSSVTRLSEWDQRIQQANDELAAITQQNTRWLERVAQLTKAQYDLEDQLNATTRNVHVADTRPTDEKENNERRQLLQLVQIQEKEIDSLKAEIHVLRRKGGHVYQMH